MANNFDYGGGLTYFPMERGSMYLGCNIEAEIAVLGCQKSMFFLYLWKFVLGSVTGLGRCAFLWI